MHDYEYKVHYYTDDNMSLRLAKILGPTLGFLSVLLVITFTAIGVLVHRYSTKKSKKFDSDLAIKIIILLTLIDIRRSENGSLHEKSPVIAPATVYCNSK